MHTRAAVQRIVFEGRRAVVVDVLLQGQRHRLHARREVLRSAGPLQSPHRLMLSGGGDGALLQQHRMREFPAIASEMERLADEAAGRVEAEVVSAAELAPARAGSGEVIEPGRMLALADFSPPALSPG